jgi:hypothetical protein
MATITQAVGVRNGTRVMPNILADLRTVENLLDRIPFANGGTAATPRLWSGDRTVAIGQVAVAITHFQTVNSRPVIDGVVDPAGGTLRLMNQLAGVTASVVQSDTSSEPWTVAEPASLPGTAPLRTQSIAPELIRRLVSVDGSSVKWFGVAVPAALRGSMSSCLPHIFFTPSPWQGGYLDPGYNDFLSWTELWDKYTSIIGSQIAASGVRQILVIPFYKNAQTGNLGDFLTNWREVVKAVMTAAIDSIDPLQLRDRFEFDGFYSSSFSNGIASLQNFHTRGAGTSAMSRLAFDLDGQASGSMWRPSPGISYRNTRAPRGVNPHGNDFHVGGRLNAIARRYPGNTDHNVCPFLLMHGLSVFGR